MKAPLIFKGVPTEVAAALDHSLREHYKCLGYSTDCIDLNCNDCALHNPHGTATVGSMALKIATATTWVGDHAQAHPDQYLDLKDILLLLKPQQEPS